MDKVIKITVSLIVAISTFIMSAEAQVSTYSELFRTLKSKDSLLFDVAFNTCNTQVLESLIAEDLEFYHDQGGITNSKSKFMDVMKNGICNPDNPTTSRRELVAGSLEVFPLYENGKLYGALQNGSHRFFEKLGDNPETKGSIAKFSHLWIKENGNWLVKRVISYDHKSQ
ncbi:nuclear transport factor 2 family protein [Winogradskyella sp. 3972H.M.0a.05]|uniref:nuclear transport factor 2 family protein n=1 Tax=Winogradskyella sp. 3972H.M.0a.05 TaxID=2950277 RepID=UPI0033944B28